MTSYMATKQQSGVNYRSTQGHLGPQMQPKGHKNGFVFRRRTQIIDWRLLASVDIERIQNELDFVCLQQNLLHITFCNIDTEIDIRYSDHNLVKLFKMSQLISEYLLHSQEYLTETINFLETKNSKMQQINSSLQNQLDKREEEMNDLKKDNKNKKNLIKELQTKVVSGAQNYFPCSMCEKSFMSDYFLQNHIQRRHPDYVKPTSLQEQQQSESLSSSKVNELEKEITHLKERLNSTEVSLEKATRSETFMKDHFQELLLRNVSMANISEGQLLRTQSTTGMAPSMDQNHSQNVNERIMRQLSDLQAKYTESQMALADAMKQKQVTSQVEGVANQSLLYDRIKQLEMENESKRIQLERLQRPEVFSHVVTPEKPRKRMTPQGQSTPKEKPRVSTQVNIEGGNGDLEIQKETIIRPVKPERKLQSGVNLRYGKQPEVKGNVVKEKDEVDSAAKILDDFSTASPSGEVKSPTDYQHANHSPSSRSVHFINHHLKSSPRDSTPCTPKDSPPKPKMSLVQWYRTTHRPKFLNRDKNDVIDNDMKIGRKGDSVDDEEGYGEEDMEVTVPRYSQSIRLTRALGKDSELLCKLRPEMEDILSKELQKLGITKGTTGISTQTLSAKLKLLQRHSNTQNYENLSELKKEYDADITEIARKQLTQQAKKLKKTSVKKPKPKVGGCEKPRVHFNGPFSDSLSGKTAKNLSTSMVEAGKGGTKDPLDYEKRDLRPEKVKANVEVEVSTPKVATNGVKPQDDITELVQEFFNDESSDSSLTPRQPSPRKHVSRPSGDNIDARKDAPVVFKAKKAPTPTTAADKPKKGDLGPDGDGDRKYVPQTNGLVNGAAKAGMVATSTLYDSGDDELSDWDESIEMINMEPGSSKPTPQPRASMQPQMGKSAIAANTSLSGTTSIQSAAKDLESKLASRPMGMSKPAGSVDVGLGLSGQNPMSASSQKSATSAAFVDSDSEPFTEDDFSKNGSSHGGITLLGKTGQPTPILSSTLKTEASPTAVIKTPTYTASKPSVTTSTKVPTRGHKDSFVSVTSFDSEDLSDFD